MPRLDTNHLCIVVNALFT